MGFIFRQYAEATKAAWERSQNRHAAREQSQAAAASRQGGTWMRRAIYGLLAFSVFAVMVGGFMQYPIVIENEMSRGWWIFRRTAVEYVTIEGIPFLKENRAAFLALISFYLGQGIR